MLGSRGMHIYTNRDEARSSEEFTIYLRRQKHNMENCKDWERLRKKLDTQGDYGSQLESQAAWVPLTWPYRLTHL